MHNIPEIIVDYERSIEIQQASNKILQVVDEISSQTNLQFYHHKKGHVDVVYVVDSRERELAYGLGKGIHSMIGAYGECIEHLIYRDIGHHGQKGFSLADFKTTQGCQEDIILRYACGLSDAPDEINCIQFNSVKSDSKVFIPRSFVNYHFLQDSQKPLTQFKSFLSRYVTTSGTAFGLTEDDAFLHALNEVIERDLTSEFFLTISSMDFLTKNTFAKLNKSTLPAYFQALIDDISKLYTPSSIELYISKTIFGNWWSICIAKPSFSSSYLLPQWGAGCSLSYDLAIYRSITECIQMLDAYEVENEYADKNLLTFLQGYPYLENIANLEAPNTFFEVPYETSNTTANLPIASQIDIICSNMILKGYRPAKHVASQGNSYSVVCAYVPNLERFYNITKCTPVLPLRYILKMTSI